jgi:hypothetical protein
MFRSHVLHTRGPGLVNGKVNWVHAEIPFGRLYFDILPVPGWAFLASSIQGPLRAYSSLNRERPRPPPEASWLLEVTDNSTGKTLRGTQKVFIECHDTHFPTPAFLCYR